MIKKFLSHLSLYILFLVAWQSIVYGVAFGAHWIFGWSITLTAIIVAVLLFVIMVSAGAVYAYRKNKSRAKRLAAIKARLDSKSAKRLVER